MGLVVQSPGDALLALIAGPSTEGAADAAPAEGGLFATMMAALFADETGDGGEGGGAEGFGPPLAAPPDQESRTSNDAALALLTATALIQFVPQSIQPEASASEAAATTIEPSGTVLEAPVGELALDVAVDGPIGAVPVEAPPSEAAGPPPPDSPSAAAPTETAAAVDIESFEQPVPVANRTAAESTADAPPAEATEEPGVVRSVGNTENSNRSNDKNGDQKPSEGSPSRRPESVEPAPKASAQGIANASANSPVGELRAAAQATPLAEAPAPAPAAPVELPQQVDQVAATVLDSVEVGATEARIRLDPAELGEVVIHIQSDADGIRIDIRAERPEAAQLLRDHSQDLSQLLGDRGLNLTDVNVGPGRRDNQEAGQGGNNGPNQPADNAFANILGIDDTGNAGLHNRLRAAYNPDGAHLYRV